MGAPLLGGGVKGTFWLALQDLTRFRHWECLDYQACRSINGCGEGTAPKKLGREGLGTERRRSGVATDRANSGRTPAGKSEPLFVGSEWLRSPGVRVPSGMSVSEVAMADTGRTTPIAQQRSTPSLDFTSFPSTSHHLTLSTLPTHVQNKLRKLQLWCDPGDSCRRAARLVRTLL